MGQEDRAEVRQWKREQPDNPYVQVMVEEMPDPLRATVDPNDLQSSLLQVEQSPK